jgi:hypothetical protein
LGFLINDNCNLIFSHPCQFYSFARRALDIRVTSPGKLVNLVLETQTNWTDARFAASYSERVARKALADHPQLTVFYATQENRTN